MATTQAPRAGTGSTSHRTPAFKPDLGAIRVVGSDAEAFLNAQISNEMLRRDDDRSLLAAWCDAKGRALALPRIVREAEDRFLLILPRSVATPVRQRLAMFVLRAQVVLEDLGDSLDFFGLAGRPALTLDGKSVPLPDARDGLVRRPGVSVLRLPGDAPRYLAVADGTAQLAVDPDTDMDANGWELAGIRAGHPQIVAATQGLFVPQMLNLHWLGGIDFRKGCYPGQEVIARLQYRGTLKRRVYRGVTPATAVPGTAVDTADGGEAGTVLRAARAPEGGSELLAVLRVDAAARRLLLDEQPLHLRDLPYPTPA